jgi:spore coat protein F
MTKKITGGYFVEHRQTLAWHETLEIHELVAFQSVGLMKLKMALKKVNDSELQVVYQKTIKDLELHITELVQYYSMAPSGESRDEAVGDLAFYAGDLLALMKASVRNYSIALTETATPVLRKTLTNHLLRSIKGHSRIYNYMYQNGYYPSYDLGELLNNDLKLANKALRMD